MAKKPQPATRVRTCRACGAKYEYPILGAKATRHHCGDCAFLPENVRRIFERVELRLRAIERALARPSPPPPAGA